MRAFPILAAFMAFAMFNGPVDARVKLKDACGADLEKFCKDVKKGEGRKACLRTHEAELQSSCADELKARDAAKASKKS